MVYHRLSWFMVCQNHLPIEMAICEFTPFLQKFGWMIKGKPRSLVISPCLEKDIHSRMRMKPYRTNQKRWQLGTPTVKLSNCQSPSVATPQQFSKFPRNSTGFTCGNLHSYLFGFAAWDLLGQVGSNSLHLPWANPWWPQAWSSWLQILQAEQGKLNQNQGRDRAELT